MNYGTCNERIAEGTCAPAQAEPLTETLKDTNRVAADVLAMSRRINAHLFGPEPNPCCEKQAEPKCFREELMSARGNLLETAKELSELCVRLGV